MVQTKGVPLTTFPKHTVSFTTLGHLAIPLISKIKNWKQQFSRWCYQFEALDDIPSLACLPVTPDKDI